MKRRMWMILAGVMVGAMMLGGAGTAWARPYVDAEEEAQAEAEAQDEQVQSNQDEQDEAQADEEGENEGEGEGEATYGAADQSCNVDHFLGFRPWYAGLTCDSDGGVKVDPNKSIQDGAGNDDGGLTVFIWTIILNVLFDITLAVGYLAVGFIIYGGFVYITAQGDPGKVVKGQKTLTSAVIGTVIAMLASIAVNTVQVILDINTSDPLDQVNSSVEVAQKVQGAFNWAYSAAGVIAVVFIIRGAFQYLTAQGDPGKVQKATRTIIYAVVGLVVVLLAAAITAFVMSSVGGAMQ